ncbi:hypothetical protein BDW69DRAFT_166271, partial [Aspergillus filifer]
MRHKYDVDVHICTKVNARDQCSKIIHCALYLHAHSEHKMHNPRFRQQIAGIIFINGKPHRRRTLLTLDVAADLIDGCYFQAYQSSLLRQLSAHGHTVLFSSEVDRPDTRRDMFRAFDRYRIQKCRCTGADGRLRVKQDKARRMLYGVGAVHYFVHTAQCMVGLITNHEGDKHGLGL